jgi:predicted ATPase
MSRIVIRNIGPLKSVEIDLKKINVFIGPQSSGKSTLVKIICFCKWVEKRALTTMKDEFLVNRDDLIEDQLLTFHRLQEIYFNESSFFSYENEHVSVVYEHEKLEISRLSDLKQYSDERKLIYIPAERNIVSALPDVTRYSDQSDNFLNFIHDWSTIKRSYPETVGLNILNLGVKFHYDKERDRDTVTLENGKELSLQNTSSGLQAVIPLVLLLDFLSVKQFGRKRVFSFDQTLIIDQALKERGLDLLDTPEKKSEAVQFMNSREYHFTQFFIEEPEQNLFPSTQRELIQHIVKACYAEDRAHELFLTTHSPYVLFTINNCILASKLDPKTPELASIEAMNAPVKADEVGLWSIKDGELECLQDEDGMLRRNYFDDTMKEIINEHQNMLSFFDEE